MLILFVHCGYENRMFNNVQFNQIGSMQKVVIFGFIAGFLLWGCRPGKQSESVQKPVAKQPDTTVSRSHSYDEFGVMVDSLQVQQHRIQRNQSLYLIFEKYGFSPQEIYAITQQAQDFVDLKHVKPGQKYRTYTTADSTNQITKMVWQPNAVDYVMFDWQNDSLQIYKASRLLKSKAAFASGTIKNSLYQTVSTEDASPLLAQRLANIFAWQIDFFSLRSGDSFKVIYNKQYIDGHYYGIGEVLAAEFTHRGKTYHAYQFEHGGTDGFFDKEGESVQKALLKAPFKFNQRISSRFSRSRFHPILKKRRPHYGVDYAAPYGTPVLAVGDGVVTHAGYSSGEGNYIKIKHNSVYETAYMHLSKYADGIHSGARVEQGEVIGYVGNTGLSTGPHLHYSLYKNDRPVNSLTVELPSADAVPDSLMAAFQTVQDSLQNRMQQQAGADTTDADSPVITAAKAR